MGAMEDGRWLGQAPPSADPHGRFVRSETRFRNWVTPDGAPDANGVDGYEAEAGRYHLYVSLACPWAHRTLIFRRLKGLEGVISLSVVHWFMGADGWTFEQGPGVIADPVYDAGKLHQVYAAALPGYTGRVTVPVLFDKVTHTIVSNESSEIIRMMNSAFARVGANHDDYYPADLRPEIDELNAEIYERVNNGVYKAGFARTQEAYEAAVRPLFATLDRLEERLATRRYLCGERITEADWRLFTTLVRFDAVYLGHFKCNLRRMVEYPNLWAFTRELYQWPGVRETVSLDHIRRHYHQSHESINPTRLVPIGPELDFNEPHGRDHLRAAPPKEA